MLSVLYRTSLGYFKSLFLINSYARSQTFKTHSNTFPELLHGWLAVQAHMLKTRHISNSFCHHKCFLNHLLTGIVLQYLSKSSLSLWFHGTSAPTLPDHPFTFPKALPFQSAVATFYPHLNKKKKSKNIQYCVNKETTKILSAVWWVWQVY